MKKTVTFLLNFLVFLQICNCQTFYQQAFTDVDGNNIPLNAYTGKKVLFFIAPLNQVDSNFIQLQAFKARYLDTIKIICVLSFEEGYQTSNAGAVKLLYNGMDITLTQGMYTRKSSGTSQSAIMKWLTDKMLNKHFDMDASGIGQKFFVSGTGRQFAVMPPQVSLAAPVINNIVHSPM